MNISLPDLAIVVVHRSDGSGTSFVWTDYLSKVSPDWKAKVGASTHVKWPLGIGGQGNDGVAKNVMEIQGSIGYVEAAFAKKRHIPVVNMINKSGKIVSPNMKSFEAAAQNTDWLKTEHFNVSLTDQPAAEAWPIVSATFILMRNKPVDTAQSKAALIFFSWAYEKGAKIATELEYVPIPDKVVAHIKKSGHLSLYLQIKNLSLLQKRYNFRFIAIGFSNDFLFQVLLSSSISVLLYVNLSQCRFSRDKLFFYLLHKI